MMSSSVTTTMLVIVTLFCGGTFFAVALNVTEAECNETECSNCYLTLVKNLMYNADNVYNLSRAFYPPTEEEPVFVTVNYNFENGNSSPWYWTSQTSTLIHPLEGFQFFSLFFGDFSSHAKTVNVILPDECDGANESYYELLTQRLKIHASTQKISPKIPTDYDATSANMHTLEERIHSDKKLTVLLYMYQFLVPIGVTLTGGLVLFSMLKTIGQYLPRETKDQNAVTLSVLSLALLTFLYAIGMDIAGISNATKSDKYSTYIHGDSALFILPYFLLFYDIVGLFLIVPLILVFWISYEKCTHGRQTYSIKDLFQNSWDNSNTVATGITCIIFVFANHSYYIIIGLINDHAHGHSVGIYYIITIVLYLVVLKMFWNICLPLAEKILNRCICNKSRDVKIKKTELKVTSHAKKGSTEIEPLLKDTSNNKSQTTKAKKILCNLRTCGVMAVFIFLIPFQIMVTAAYVYIPIKRTVEDIPNQIDAIYQSLIVLFTALITYKLFVDQPKKDTEQIKITLKLIEKFLRKINTKNILNVEYWLEDSDILKAMELMSKGKKSSDIEVCMTETLKRNGGVQIVHTGGNHWVTIKSEEDGEQIEVIIFDSLKPESGVLADETKEHICSLLKVNEDQANFTYANVQQQKNGCDCGLFAIAFAMELCEGHSKEDIEKKQFDTGRMREHLVDCLNTNKITPFPSERST